MKTEKQQVEGQHCELMPMYVRCINNKQFLQHPSNEGDDEIVDLIVGYIYKVVLDSVEEERGFLRVVDESGEDYTFPASYFEPVEARLPHGKTLDAQITIHLSEMDKAVLRAEALASQKSMSALIREWIDERLDLPELA